MLNQYHPRAPLKRIFVQNGPKPYCHFVILSRLPSFPWLGWRRKGEWYSSWPQRPWRGQQLPAQGNALGKEHVRRTRWKCKSTTRCRCCSQSFCPYRALVYCPRPARALPWAMSGLALQAALIQRGNCDIIAKNKESAWAKLQVNEWRAEFHSNYPECEQFRRSQSCE